MTYEEWLEANCFTDDANAQLMYEEQAQKVGRPYDEWRKRYGYSDTATARADYAEYQKQLDILTPAKRGPGRPPTGKALTPAEKQRAYRERLKKRETELEGTSIAYDQVCAEKHEISMKLIKTEARVLVLEQQLENALAEIERIKGNVT